MVIVDMLLQPDGKLVVAGNFGRLNGRPVPGMARLLPDGQVDTAFAAPLTNGQVFTLARQADGKLLVGGDFTTVGGQPRFGLARLLPTGVLDPGFLPPYGGGPPPYAYTIVNKIVVQPGRGILLLGRLIIGTSPGRFAARLLEATGAVDPAFQLPANVSNTVINDVLVLPSGRLVFSGRPSLFNGQLCTVWGGLPDGAFDPAFVPLPGINTYSEAYTLARDPATGKLYVVRDSVGGTLDFEPLRLLPTGVPDPGFSIAGVFPQPFGGASSLAVQPNGRLLMGGGFYAPGGGFYGSVRLLPSGARDPSYDPSLGPGSEAYKVLIQPDGKLLFCGYFTQAGGFALNCLARMLDPNVLSARAPGPLDDDDELPAWPVPAREALHLGLPAGRLARQAALLDALGRVVLRQALAPGEAAPVLPTAGLPPGGYLLRVDFASGLPAYRRVAVE